jgi:hypothetical protein
VDGDGQLVVRILGLPDEVQGLPHCQASKNPAIHPPVDLKTGHKKFEQIDGARAEFSGPGR